MRRTTDASRQATSQSIRENDAVNGWLAVCLIFVLTIVTYLPVMRGDLLWDDQAHITREDLRSADGLRRIWFELGATQQFYPLLHTAFWIEHKLWGDSLLGYHLTNVLLHATAASLVFAVVRKLQIPGALLAALIFALHPVNVESVAWITEQKNTLSAVFYLSAMWVYLDFDQARQPRSYWTASRAVRARTADENGHGHVAGGAIGDLLVATGHSGLAPRRAAADSVLRAGRNCGAGNGLDRADHYRRRRSCLRDVVRRTRTPRRKGPLVLSFEAIVADGSGVHLSAVEDRCVRLVAVVVSAGHVCRACGTVDAATSFSSRRSRGRCFSWARCFPCLDFSTSTHFNTRSWPTTFSTWRVWE